MHCATNALLASQDKIIPVQRRFVPYHNFEIRAPIAVSVASNHVVRIAKLALDAVKRVVSDECELLVSCDADPGIRSLYQTPPRPVLGAFTTENTAHKSDPLLLCNL